MNRLGRTLTIAMAASLLCAGAACAEKDYSVAGWYYVDSVFPAGSRASDMMDRPSGRSLRAVADYEEVYVCWQEEIDGATWDYCQYEGSEGYIRRENLVSEGY